MTKIIQEDYFNCSIVFFQYFTKEYYEVKHKKTHNTLHVLSLAEAFRVAQLLDLEYRIYNWMSAGYIKG